MLLNRLLIGCVLAATFFLALYARAQDAVHSHHAAKSETRYTCPMHPDVVTDAPGKCPKCGMTLVPVKEKNRSTSDVERPTLNSEEHQHTMPMQSSVSIADPMSRESSGTAWIPDSTPM